MAPLDPIDAIFAALIIDLELAMELALSGSRRAHLAKLAEHAQRLHHLATAALILALNDSSDTLQNPLD